ncbi:hypothetical protein ID866_11088 [Astraeus odoratus]|nr:hypothetical protein ID866_11088 [Astraeus odoratus]
MCTTELPEIVDVKGNKVQDIICHQHGYYNIENELVFHSNLGFIFHDSCGVETGSVKELKDMKIFVSWSVRFMLFGKTRCSCVRWDGA